MMREYNYSTKRGFEIYKMGAACDCTMLSEIYSSYSLAKQRAYSRCLHLYGEGLNHTGFRIGNANTFSFTASWYEVRNDENVMRVETYCNSYLVWLDR